MTTDLTIQLKVLNQGLANVDKADKSFSNLFKTLQSTGSRINVLGQRLTFMATVPMVMFANKAIETGVEVERSWVRFNKVFGGTEEELQKMITIGTEMSNKFGQNVEDVNGVMAEFAKVGISDVDALKRLSEMTIETSMLFDSTLEEAVTGVSAVMLGFGLSVDKTADALAAINIIADNTASSEKGILTAMEKSGGIARTYGVDLREVAAMTAVFQQNSISGAVAGNALKSIMQKLGNPTKKVKDEMLGFGVNMNSAAYKSLGFSEKLELLAKTQHNIFTSNDKVKIADWNAAMSDTVGIFQGARMSILLEDFGKQLDNNSETISTYTTAMDISADSTKNLIKWNDQLKKQMESDPFNLDVQNQLYRNQVAILGKELLPYKIKLLEILTGLLEKWNNLSPATQEFYLKALMLVAVLGPLLVVIGNLVTTIGFLGQGINFLVMGPLTALLTKLGFIQAGVGAAGGAGLAASFATFGVLLAGTFAAVQVVRAIMAFNDLQAVIASNKQAIDTLRKKTEEYEAKIGSLSTEKSNDQLRKSVAAMQAATNEADRLTKRYEGLGGAANAVGDKLSDWAGKIGNAYESMSKKVASAVKRLEDSGLSGKVVGKIIESLAGGLIGSWVDNLNKSAQSKANQSGSISTASTGGIVYANNGYFSSKGRDTIPAMLSPGEMVLNGSQQSSLWNMLNGRSQSSSGSGNEVHIHVGNMIASRGEMRQFKRFLDELGTEDQGRYVTA